MISCQSQKEESFLDFVMSHKTSLLGGPPSMIVNQGPAYFSPPFVLDTLAPDILVSMANVTSMISIHISGMIYCPEFQSETEGYSPTEQEYDDCGNKNPPVLGIINGTVLYSDGSMAQATDNLTLALNQSITNYMKALSVAFQADMGIWQNNSFLANKDMLNISISSADAVSAVVAANPNLKAYYSIVDNVITIGAQTLRTESYTSSYPSQVITIPLPTSYQRLQSIATTFICHTQQLKGTFSLVVCMYFFYGFQQIIIPFVAIIVADASEFGALWAFAMLIATYFARRHEISGCAFFFSLLSVPPVRKTYLLPISRFIFVQTIPFLLMRCHKMKRGISVP
jgi:hypothetical protein